MKPQRGKENKLIVADAGWAETLPQWLLEEIEAERITIGLLRMLKPETEPIGDAEVTAYLYTANLKGPISHEWTQIYFYLSGTLLRRRQSEDLPDFIGEKLDQGLTEDEKRELTDLRRMIFQKRGGEVSHPLFDALRAIK